MTTAAQALARLATRIQPVDLDTVNQRAELLARVDRKYVVTGHELEQLMESLCDRAQVLEVQGLRLLRYSSTYFDTLDLATYSAHRQRRRRRYKIRLRSYLDTDAHFLEVKYKGRQQVTVKDRLPQESAAMSDGLSPEGLAFAAEVIGRAYQFRIPGPLTPSVTTRNARSTFLFAADASRMTVDVNVNFDDGLSAGGLHERFAILETKSPGRATYADQVLRRMNVRPAQVSKYCTAVGLLRPDVPSNRWHHLTRSYFEPRPEPGSSLAVSPHTSHQLAG